MLLCWQVLPPAVLRRLKQCDVIPRFLELESSGRRDEIRFHYTHERQSRVETFPYRLADNQWHRLALSLSGDHLTVLIDCSKIYERVIQTVDRTYTLGRLSLFIGQRNTQQAHFKGALQDIQIVTESHGYLLQCPNHDTDCPTCAQYQALERKVRDMYDLYQNLSLKLLHAEQRISNLEECECLKSCSDNGTVRKEGEMWKPDACTVCMCRNGTVDCQHVDCSPVECEHPVYQDGKCCPICSTNCYYHGKYFDHGVGFSPKVCVTCTCENGSMVCKKQIPEETCSHLNCSLADRLYIPGECCPVCKGTDFCALGNDCHINATCVNLATRYACQCHSGFQGDGSYCKDIDECAEEGGKNGHHCHGKTKCVNTIGSYKCQCANGHDHTDPYTCEEVDECEREDHNCDENAVCINTEGSYICRCKNHFEGDGYSCEPICNGNCQNGGRCIAPNVCECRHGYIGPNCELDIDECALGISACHGHSVCINTQGWYHCDCLEGYHSNWPDNHYGSLCMDINECIGEGSGHTCHNSMICDNTEGGYNCECRDDDTACVQNCIHEGSEHEDDTSWISVFDKCIECYCHVGVSTCHKKVCDCTDDGVDLECCPHCDITAQCEHQEIPLFLPNGAQWEFQCQTCECLNGEIDCWPLECPNTACHRTVQEPGDCCPRCIDDNPCVSLQQNLGGADHSATTCMYAGNRYFHGDNWILPSDHCSTCECKAGHICCAFNQNCTLQLET